jgi:circadian clock protein KaiC
MSTINEEADDPDIIRLASGVPGLDAVLCGGFLRGGLYIVQGPPGSGKTILANQIAHHNAGDQGRAIFITVLGENHARMMLHLKPMRFSICPAFPIRSPISAPIMSWRRRA